MLTGYDRMQRYINDVKGGKILTNEWIKKAIKRHENDLKKSESDDYPYYFNPELGNKFIQFCECLKQVNDKWAGEPLKLMDWQVFFFMSIYSWVRKDNNTRRFRKAWLYTCRKSGKSTIVACSALYDLLTVNGSQVCLAATVRAQASLVFDVVRGMVEQNPSLSSRLKIYNSTLRIVNEKNYGRIEVLSADTKKTGDGKNVSLGIFDECSASDYGIYKIIESGQGSRPQPLNLLISSGSDDLYSMGKQEYDRSKQILNGVIEDDSYFCLLYCLPEDADWRDESLYQMANPSLGVTCSKEFLHKMRVQAEQTPSLQTEFKCKNLGLWCNSESAWINYTNWQVCIDNSKKYKFDPKKPYFATIGIDLSKRNDLTGAVLCLYQDGKYFLISKSYFPKESMRERITHEGEMWQAWTDCGLLTATQGKTIDYQCLYKDIREWAEKYTISEILYDPYSSNELINELSDSFEMVEVQQSLRYLSPMTKAFEACVLNGNIVCDNPVLSWMVSNATVYSDANGNIKVIKNTNEKGGNNSKRIDNLICSIMCVGRTESLRENGELIFTDPNKTSENLESFLSSLKWD